VSCCPVIGVAISPGATALTVMPVLGELQGHDLGEQSEAALGRAVGGGTDPRLVFMDGGHVDDPAAVAL